MTADSSYIDRNTHERERLRALVERLSDDDLRRPVSEQWTVATVLGHMAFWDARALWLAEKIARGEPFTASDVEPEDVTWVNDAARHLIDAIPPRDTAQLALRLAEEVDQHVAALPPERVWPNDPHSLLNAFRAEHRGEHLDEIEAALRGTAV
jgi:hypothetical protein